MERPHPHYNADLPIFDYRETIIAALRRHPIVIIAGETGSGKTTQLPQMCLEAGRGQTGQIGCTQPRRLAARTIAARVAEELRLPLGGPVGYRVRFGGEESAHTLLRFMTDGILLTELRADPLLKRYDTIILDEAHERSVNIDFLLGVMKRISAERPHFRLLVTSATIDTEAFAEHFNGAPVLSIPGRAFPVEYEYLPRGEDDDYVDAAARAAEDAHHQGEGNTLVFLPTERDIHDCRRSLTQMNASAQVLPLYSRLARHEQERVFSAGGARKIILATNIAETSLTVPGVRTVIDTGLARTKRFIPQSRATVLPVEKISRASCDQRAGRAGRLAPGCCVRLFSEHDYKNRREFTTPELRRSNMAGIVLQMRALGLGEVDAFPFMDPPRPAVVRDAVRQLNEIGALDEQGRLTPHGKQLARLPLDPNLSHMILSADCDDVCYYLCVIVSFLEAGDIRDRPADKQEAADRAHADYQDPASDFAFPLTVWREARQRLAQSRGRLKRWCRDRFLNYLRLREWRSVQRQLTEDLKHIGVRLRRPVRPPDMNTLHRHLLSGFYHNVCLRRDETVYKGGRDRDVYLFPGSVLSAKKPLWIVAADITETSRNFARMAAPIKPEWLPAAAPAIVDWRNGEPFFDPRSGSVKLPRRPYCRGVPVGKHQTTDYTKIDRDRASDIFLRDGIVSDRLKRPPRELKPVIDTVRTMRQWEAVLRRPGDLLDEDGLVRRLRERLGAVGRTDELEDTLRRRPDLLADITADSLLLCDLPPEVKDYPRSLNIGGRDFPLEYRCDPTDPDNDGSFLRVPAAAVPFLPEVLFDWVFGPRLEEKLRGYLRALPKRVRRQWPPDRLCDAVRPSLRPQLRPFVTVLNEALAETGVDTAVSAETAASQEPAYLVTGVVVTNEHGREVDRGKGPDGVRRLKQRHRPGKSAAYRDLHQRRRQYHHDQLTDWPGLDLPARIDLTFPEATGALDSEFVFPLIGYPALEYREKNVRCRLHLSAPPPDDHPRAVYRLLTHKLRQNKTSYRRYVSLSQRAAPVAARFTGDTPVHEAWFELMVRSLPLKCDGNARSAADFRDLTETAQHFIRAGLGEISDIFERTAAAYYTLTDRIQQRRRSHPYVSPVCDDVRDETDELLRRLFHEGCYLPLTRLLPDCLRAKMSRLERALSDPGRDRRRKEETEERLSPLRAALTERPSPGGTAAYAEAEAGLESVTAAEMSGGEIRPSKGITIKKLRKQIDALP